MDTHLETIPGLGTFTTRRLPGSDSQSLNKITNTGYLVYVYRRLIYNQMNPPKNTVWYLSSESYFLSYILLMLTLLPYTHLKNLKKRN